MTSSTRTSAASCARGPIAVVGATDRPASYGAQALLQPRRGRLRRRRSGASTRSAPRCSAGRACRRSPTCPSRSTRWSWRSRPRACRRRRAGRRARLRRRGGGRRGLRRGRRRRGAAGGARRRRARATGCRCAGRTATGSSPMHARAALWGDALAAARARAGGARLPERQRRRQRARPRGAGCASTRWSPAATRPCCRPPTTSSSWPASDGRRRDRAVPRGRRRPARCARRWPRCAERGIAGGGAEGRELARRGARGRAPTPARWPATSGSSAALVEEAGRGLGATTSTSCWSWPRRSPCGRPRAARGARAGDHDLLGRRLGPGRRRGRSGSGSSCRRSRRRPRAARASCCRRRRPSPTRSTTRR